MAINAVNDNREKTAYAHELDAQAYNGDDLGAVYTPGATTFKVWAPTATGVAVKLYTTGSPAEEGAQDISTTAMKKGKNGVWSVTIKGDQKNRYYTYLVTNNGKTTETADVYSKAVGVNGNRSMVVDLKSTDPQGWDQDHHVLYDDPTDAVVWEVHVRDFSISESSGVSEKNRGKYLAFTEQGTTLDGKGDIPTCVAYLKELGITHVQLLPVYDYATVDESKENPEEYNWGYDPKNYNVPEGSYSTNAFDGNVRIKEFKQMIQALHNAGIGVIMDVVFNHTYTAKGSCFENTVPGYYFRMNKDGTFADASACGNETASDHLMYRKYMIDSILYWTNEYHIDGFRFDLMGIHDVDTMNQIRQALDTKVENGSRIIMYGEPWAASAVATTAKTCTKENIRLLNERIGAFNDDFRDAVKGHVFNGEETGFVQDGSFTPQLVAGITANSLKNVWAKQPSQAIAYTSAHDNYTLYDKLVISMKKDESFGERDNTIVNRNKLAAAITLTSQGINFLQAGEEFARTKYGDENSFISSDKINQLNWHCLETYGDLRSYYQGLMEIRRSFKPFRDPTTTSGQKITFSDTDNGVIAYTLENVLTKGKEWSYAAVAFNASGAEARITLKSNGGKLPERWVILVDGDQAGLRSLGEVNGNEITVPAHTAMVLVDQESFEKLAVSSEQCVVNVEYRDSESGELLNKQVLKGKEGSSYRTMEDASFALEYDLKGTTGAAEGKFTSADQTVTYTYEKFKGNIYTLTVNYLKAGKSILASGDTKLAEAFTQKLRDGSSYHAPVKPIDGMCVDLGNFPEGAAGVVSGADIQVDYYYTMEEPSDLKLHYFEEGADKVYVKVFTRDTDGEETVLVEETTMMEPDAALGSGWFSYTLKGKGSVAGLMASFSGRVRSGEEYAVARETWIKDQAVTATGLVTAVYIDENGKLLDSETLQGKQGEAYSTEQRSFENLKISAVTDNAKGVFDGAHTYVFYKYDKLSITEKPVMTVIYVLCGSALAMIVLAGVMGVIHSRRKKRWKV